MTPGRSAASDSFLSWRYWTWTSARPRRSWEFDQVLTVALFIVFYCLPSLFLRARSLNSLLKQCCGPVKLQILRYPFPIKSSQQWCFVFFLHFTGEIHLNFSDVIIVNTSCPCLIKNGKISLLMKWYLHCDSTFHLSSWEAFANIYLSFAKPRSWGNSNAFGYGDGLSWGNSSACGYGDRLTCTRVVMRSSKGVTQNQS